MVKIVNNTMDPVFRTVNVTDLVDKVQKVVTIASDIHFSNKVQLTSSEKEQIAIILKMIHDPEFNNFIDQDINGIIKEQQLECF